MLPQSVPPSSPLSLREFVLALPARQPDEDMSNEEEAEAAAGVDGDDGGLPGRPGRPWRRAREHKRAGSAGSCSSSGADGMRSFSSSRSPSPSRSQSPSTSPPHLATSAQSGCSSSDEGDATPSSCQRRRRLAKPPPASRVPPLPPSSVQGLPLPAAILPAALGAYAFLRSFSRTLFLAPFSFSDLAAALRSPAPSRLLAAVHLQLLRLVQRQRADSGADRDSPFRPLFIAADWSRLDELTWPELLRAQLLAWGFPPALGASMRSDYGRWLLSAKVVALATLCDEVLETAQLRTEVALRERREPLEAPAPLPQQGRLAGRAAAPAEQDDNTDECVVCGMAGNLLCCDGCPGAFHSRCVGVARASLPDGEWFCPECAVGRPRPQWAAGLRTEPLGTDPHGRAFWLLCGYLLVADLEPGEAADCRVYRLDALPAVLDYLKRCGQRAAGLRTAVQQALDQEAFAGSTAATNDKGPSTGSVLAEQGSALPLGGAAAEATSGKIGTEVGVEGAGVLPTGVPQGDAGGQGLDAVVTGGDGCAAKVDWFFGEAGAADATPIAAKALAATFESLQRDGKALDFLRDSGSYHASGADETNKGCPARVGSKDAQEPLAMEPSKEQEVLQASAGTVPLTLPVSDVENLIPTAEPDEGPARAGSGDVADPQVAARARRLSELVDRFWARCDEAVCQAEAAAVVVEAAQPAVVAAPVWPLRLESLGAMPPPLLGSRRLSSLLRPPLPGPSLAPPSSMLSPQLRSPPWPPPPTPKLSLSPSAWLGDQYMNAYTLGEVAATAASILLHREVADKVQGRRGKVDDLSAQAVAFARAAASAGRRFAWPAAAAWGRPGFLPGESLREKCGWCRNCSVPSNRQRCALITAEGKSASAGCSGGSSGTLLLPPADCPDLRVTLLAAYVLQLEASLHGLLEGPWESAHWPAVWRAHVEAARAVRDVIPPLRQLDGALRQVALAGNWRRDAEDSSPPGRPFCPWLSDGVPVVLANDRAVVPGKRRAGRAGSSVHPNIVVTSSSSARRVAPASGVQWYRGGRFVRLVVDWEVLPKSTARRAARQGGRKAINGVLYRESGAPQRTQQCAWQARVERAICPAQLALQLRVLDSRIRWEDLKPPKQGQVPLASSGSTSTPGPTPCSSSSKKGRPAGNRAATEDAQSGQAVPSVIKRKRVTAAGLVEYSYVEEDAVILAVRPEATDFGEASAAAVGATSGWPGQKPVINTWESGHATLSNGCQAAAVVGDAWMETPRRDQPMADKAIRTRQVTGSGGQRKEAGGAASSKTPPLSKVAASPSVWLEECRVPLFLVKDFEQREQVGRWEAVARRDADEAHARLREARERERAENDASVLAFEEARRLRLEAAKVAKAEAKARAKRKARAEAKRKEAELWEAGAHNVRRQTCGYCKRPYVYSTEGAVCSECQGLFHRECMVACPTQTAPSLGMPSPYRCQWCSSRGGLPVQPGVWKYGMATPHNMSQKAVAAATDLLPVLPALNGYSWQVAPLRCNELLLGPMAWQSGAQVGFCQTARAGGNAEALSGSDGLLGSSNYRQQRSTTADVKPASLVQKEARRGLAFVAPNKMQMMSNQAFQKVTLIGPGARERRGREEGAAPEPVCALCYKPFDDSKLYISCSFCSAWVHAEALYLDAAEAQTVASFKCHKCRRAAKQACPPRVESGPATQQGDEQASAAVAEQAMRKQKTRPLVAVLKDPMPAEEIADAQAAPVRKRPRVAGPMHAGEVIDSHIAANTLPQVPAAWAATPTWTSAAHKYPTRLGLSEEDFLSLTPTDGQSRALTRQHLQQQFLQQGFGFPGISAPLMPEVESVLAPGTSKLWHPVAMQASFAVPALHPESAVNASLPSCGLLTARTEPQMSAASSEEHQTLDFFKGVSGSMLPAESGDPSAVVTVSWCDGDIVAAPAPSESAAQLAAHGSWPALQACQAEEQLATFPFPADISQEPVGHDGPTMPSSEAQGPSPTPKTLELLDFQVQSPEPVSRDVDRRVQQVPSVLEDQVNCQPLSAAESPSSESAGEPLASGDAAAALSLQPDEATCSSSGGDPGRAPEQQEEQSEASDARQQKLVVVLRPPRRASGTDSEAKQQLNDDHIGKRPSSQGDCHSPPSLTMSRQSEKDWIVTKRRSQPRSRHSKKVKALPQHLRLNAAIPLEVLSTAQSQALEEPAYAHGADLAPMSKEEGTTKRRQTHSWDPCCICDRVTVRPQLRCQSCQIAVHRQCYLGMNGASNPREDAWECDACRDDVEAVAGEPEEALQRVWCDEGQLLRMQLPKLQSVLSPTLRQIQGLACCQHRPITKFTMCQAR
eukprot:SM000196S05364  [mRNA]  locus=s196:101805:111463:+ [translate_table: standard]